MHKIGHIFEKSVRLVAIIGIAFLSIAAVLTVADVALRRSAGITIPGLVDLTQLMMMYAIYFGIIYAFTVRAHVTVTILTDKLPHRAKRFVAGVWWLASSVIMAVLAYASWTQAADQFEYGDISQTIGIPMIYYWLPVVVGLIICVPASLHVAIGDLFDADNH